MKRSPAPTSLVLLILCLALVGIEATDSRGQGTKTYYQINCGGPTMGPYEQDSHFQGGQTSSDNELVYHANVPNGPPNDVYKTQRTGDFSYVFPDLKPNTEYK